MPCHCRPVAAPAGRPAASAKACEPRRLTDDERKFAPPPGGDWDAAHRRVTGIVDGDVVLIDTVTRARTLITRTAAIEAHARWSDGDRAITFTRDQGLYRVWVDRDAASTATAFEQITDAGPAKPRPAATDSQQFLKSEEEKLLAAVREAEAKKAKADARKDAQSVPRLTVGEKQAVEGLVLAHEGKIAYAIVGQQPAASRRADVPAYVTATSYPETLTGRGYVGDAQERRRLVAIDLAAKSETTIALEGAEADPKSGPLLWSLPIVSSTGRDAATVVVSADNEHRYIVALAPGGNARIVEHLRDTAWVRALDESGPPPTSMGFLPGGSRLWFLSERDGWMHLYLADLAAPQAPPRQLTSGAWEVTAVELTPDGRQFLITSTEADAGERHVYAMSLDGGPRTRLTTTAGAHQLEPSPDATTWALISSFPNRPPEVFLAKAPAAGAALADGAAVPVTTSPTSEWLAGRWIAPRVVTYTARDGVDGPRAALHAGDGGREAQGIAPGGGVRPRRRLPPERAPATGRTYYREYMFHHLLASRGYVVLDLDYRGSAGYGRDWRTAIYPAHGRQGSRRRRRRRALAGRDREGGRRSASASTAAATAASSR